MKIAVLVSGGVDSAVVVDMLYKEGHELHLFYIRIGMDNDEGDCSAEEDIEICTLLSKKYGLPLEIVSLHEEYWEYVMKYALDTVSKGLTPNPDMMCNKFIKFGFFEDRYGRDFDQTATGHYASTIWKGDRKFLATAVDPVKDQTDFLSAITYRQLEHAIFPLGNMPKEEVRKKALEAGLPNATRKDSQGICFLGKINYNDFIRRKLGEKKGDIINIETGEKLGEHKGFWFHTIGQRKGLGLSGGPWFVVKKDSEANVLYVSKGYDTPLQYSRDIWLEPVHWITVNPFEDNSLETVEMLNDGGVDKARIMFKNRHTPEFIEGVLECRSGYCFLKAERDVQGVAPGQFVTIYSPDKKLCLGSAMISGSQNKD